MSKINCFRAINLNYNNNAMRIEDETFRFEGDSTLLSLQNGGGKSVLVQMMIAPFVRRRYRDTADRAFASFFTTVRPTFLLTEWLLDGGAGYVLVGMMVRQRQEAEEDSKEELDIVSFVHEYRESNPFDIHNLPVIETEGRTKKLKGFHACKLLFEEARKERGLNFQYFDLNQTAHQRKYFDRLREFQINNTEWEAIIKKVNLKESGLSELFKDAKDEAGLVEKWFLSAVESKLNKEENRMKEFAGIIHKFILQYKENQSKIERKETIAAFRSDAELIRESAQQFRIARQEKLQYEEKLAYLRKCLSALLEKRTGEREILEERLTVLEQQLQNIRYEEASYQLYCLMDELELLFKKQEDREQARTQLQERIDALSFRLHTMECAGLYEEYRECSGEVLLLENKLEVLKAQEKELLPERNQLGYNLRCRYEDAVEKQEKYLEELEEQQLSKREELEIISEKEAAEQKQAQEWKQLMGQLQANIKVFDKEEQEFNKRYGTRLERNILGVYEEGALEVMKAQLENALEELQRKLMRQRSKKVQMDESITSFSRNMEDHNARLGELKQQSMYHKERLAGYEEQLEARRMILRFMGLGEAELFQPQRIGECFNRKIEELGQAKRSLERKGEELEEEYRKLETGKLLELPGEFSELLRSMDISYVYGMDWLKKNGNSAAVNQKLVQQNPMLPYSIIMSGRELKQLAAARIDFYTSFPVPIIRREDLAFHQEEEVSCIYEMNKISFFVLFNHHLLDAAALKELLEQKQTELNRIGKLLGQKETEIREYEDRYNAIKYQTVTESSYRSCIAELEACSYQTGSLEKELNELRERKEVLQRQQRELQSEIEQGNRQEANIRSQIQDFEKLYRQYGDYLKERKELEQIGRDLEILGRKIAERKQRIAEINEFIQASGINRERERMKLRDLQRKLNEYQSYQTGEWIHKDLEDLEARFEALTRKISEDQLQLEESLGRAKDRFDKKQQQLLDKEALYGLSEPDYKDVKMDAFTEREVRRERSSQEERLGRIREEYNQVSTSIAVLENRVREGKMLLEERFEKLEPIPRERIVDLEFKRRARLILADLEKEKEQKKSCEEKIACYENNLSGLAEFDQLTTEQSFFFETELSAMNKSSLEELEGKEWIAFRGRLVRDYRKSDEVQDEKREALGKCLDGIAGKKKYEEEFFKRPLETLTHLAHEPKGILEQLEIILSSFHALLEKLEVDIAIVEREQAKVTEMLLDYICEIHKNLGKIDRNSTITVRERSIKMLKIKLPEWEEQESIYQQRMRGFMEGLIISGLQRLDQNENLEEMIGSNVTTRNLYDTVVGIGNVGIRLYKIEAQREYPITWAEVAKNSGGEGFLSAFVVLSSLLSYMRREDTDLFYEKEEGKVLVMDNPFAQTNAAHLLKPLMDIARKNNTQLICLSGLGGESIYNRFDNIYVLNLMESGLQKDVQYLKGEHIKGEKPILTIRASQVKVEEMEQMELLF
ncbi:hypothetical protein HNQ56_004071 [Anaerotaenia torta]|uniref:hypothetical protein n=1 Tax=Anaerotaenia torta TaxID=433293 RepID=UPI003D20D976